MTRPGVKTEVIAWPEMFGVPQRAGYHYTPADRRAKAEMEIGSRYRMLYDSDETVVQCDFALNYEDLALFEAFEKHILRQGSVWFTMPLFTAGSIERHTVRFKERPTMGDFRNGTAMVSMVLDLAERRTFDEETAWLLYAMGGQKSFAYMEDVLQNVINQYYPRAMPYFPAQPGV